MHTHITNTHIGDIELLERRYPVLLHCFALRTDSVGKGHWHGGEGVLRELEVLQWLQVLILRERRTRQPFGMEGSGVGGLGWDTWVKRPRAEDRDLRGEVPYINF